MKKVLIILAVLIVLGGGAYLYQRTAKQAKAPANESPITQNTDIQQASGTQAQAGTSTQDSKAAATQSAKSLPPSKKSVGTYSSGDNGEVVGSDVQVWEVDFDGKGFSPSSIDIKLGDIIIFKNKSTEPFWPVSGSADYPDLDAGKSIVAGGRFQFQFTKAGQFGYHDKLNPSATGTVNVSR